MNKEIKGNKNASNIVKGGAVANHDSTNISADKKPLLTEKPTSSENSAKGNKKNG